MKTEVALTKPTEWQAWFLATRPKTLTIGFFPVLAATFLAQTKGVVIDWSLMIFTFLTTLSIQIGTNLVNDALDFKKGADTKERLGPQRVSQRGWLPAKRVLVGGLFCFILSLLFGIPLVFKGGLPILLLLLLSIVLGYCYTGGPIPLAYYGLGDLFSFFFFGIVISCVPFFLQAGWFSKEALLLGVQVGCLPTLNIAIGNLRDVEGDAKAKKKTLVVRFGKFFSRCEISLLALTPFLLNPLWMTKGYLMAAWLPFLVFPLTLLIIQKIWMNEPGKIYNTFFGLAAFLHASFNLLLSIGFIAH